ncbi:MAG: hypothetical protein A3B47_01345 [Candidatus Levybacteria bacterium RIFCSPLOWO2_01_FULL_39_24]|nr:MAG: hypothetical protein A2800_03380 [Candidatus Levybacteria bacterium RIFCSPHIGHO2_01_FULL_40_16]OGH28632.1 MAG: hypothetical protein A3E12_03280 [Candidatus Levybacteria bacterium RIFCSPHIGHO2_12_FULL_39_9]OGH46021.1 MAG: hypothetical protein A3B47_01345 [Candidatus Levybacteria bacterium RIFCSPLOWO2_01_FULL_39_24]
MTSNFILLGFSIISLWLFIVSIFLWKALSHYNKLGRGLKDKDFKSIMEALLEDTRIAKKDINGLKLYCDKIQKDGFLHIQKIGLVRFNPFKDTGGDQSFILSLVDGNDTGVIISGLYARSGTRWYAKRVVEGKSLEHELSDEEKKALKEARA